MLFMQLTLSGAFDRLQSEREKFGRQAGAMAKALRWTGGLALAIGIAGCAAISVDSSPEAKQKVVAERAVARWQLLIKGDVGGAYQYLSLGSKAGTPLEMYKGQIRPGLWRAAKVDKVDCEAEICKVQLLITYDFRNMKGIETLLPETWIIENGSAWYVYR